MEIRTDTEWIDKILIDKAKETSNIILSIDASWKRYLETMQQHDFRFPFPGQYEIFFDETYLLIKGWEGKLVIDKLVSVNMKQMKILNQPLICENFSVWGQFSAEKTFVNFYACPAFGVHYRSGDIKGKYKLICLGNMKFKPITSYKILQEATKTIAKNLEVINLDSIGIIYLPNKYEEFKVWIEKYKDASTSERIRLIKQISHPFFKDETIQTQEENDE